MTARQITARFHRGEQVLIANRTIAFERILSAEMVVFGSNIQTHTTLGTMVAINSQTPPISTHVAIRAMLDLTEERKIYEGRSA